MEILKPLKRTIINLIIFVIAYAGVMLVLTHHIDVQTLLILAVVYFVLNYVIYSILDKVSHN